MGFETLQLIEYRIEGIHYETSLWDLKRIDLFSDSVLKSYYETSLWDLKLYKIHRVCYRSSIMRHPYGI